MNVEGDAKFNNIEDVYGIKSTTDLEFMIDKNNSGALLGFFEVFNGAGNHIFWVNEAGNARFYGNLFFDNGTVQTTAGPLATALLDASGTGTVNVVGSNSLSAIYNTTGDYIEVTYSGGALSRTTHLIHVTPIRVNSSSATLDRSASIYFDNGKVRVYVWDASAGVSVINDCYITIYQLKDGSPLTAETEVPEMGKTMEEPPEVQLSAEPETRDESAGITEESDADRLGLMNRDVSAAGSLNDLKTIITEQREEIGLLQDQNSQLEERLSKLERLLGSTDTADDPRVIGLSSAKLFQNQPNPFSDNTLIRYFIPEGVQDAQLTVTAANGQVIKVIPIQESGRGETILQNQLLSKGQYQYSLVIDGIVQDTKKMILQK